MRMLLSDKGDDILETAVRFVHDVRHVAKIGLEVILEKMAGVRECIG
jgi:hypothetical protein